jgi:hypothetical protein
MAILSTLLQDSATAISPALSANVAITVMLFCNNNTQDPLDSSAGKQLLDVHVVPDSGSISNENRIMNQIPIDAGDTFTFDTVRLVLSPGDRVYALSTNSDTISSTISYVLI